MAFLCYDIGRLLCQVSHRGRFFDWVPVEFLANVREVRNSGFATGVRGGMDSTRVTPSSYFMRYVYQMKDHQP